MPSNKIDNGSGGGSVSGGSMSNPMYQKVVGGGKGYTYSPNSGREHRRYWERQRRKDIKKYGYPVGRTFSKGEYI
tara:strand:+ start:692 stop:916 length:225 start_codon:yes stop_codon:yes gene_type:complete